MLLKLLNGLHLLEKKYFACGWISMTNTINNGAMLSKGPFLKICAKLTVPFVYLWDNTTFCYSYEFLHVCFLQFI